MKEENLTKLIMGSGLIPMIVMIFFAGVAVRDDIFTHETAKNIALIFSFFTIATVYIYTYYKRES